jgi:GntR family transcriptional regulator / MocR family aminotransferase
MSALRDAARKHLQGLVDVTKAVAGMRTIGWLKTRTTDIAVAERARSLGLELTALSEFTIRYSLVAGVGPGFCWM